MTDAAIQSAMKAARIFLNNTEERRRYINREMSIMDYNSDHENARAEGRAEGERNMEITIVKRMLLKHKPLNEIIDVVSWPKEKVLTFAKENNLSIYE
jgi:cell division septum initiation protein DivIVA